MFSVPVLAAVLSLAGPARVADTDETAARLVEIHLKEFDQENPVPPNPFGPSTRNFRGQLERIVDLARDQSVDGIRLHVDGRLDYARTLDVVRVLKRLKSAGKKIICYAETLSERDLMTASLADFLVVPPSGQVALEGPTMELMYFKDLLEKVNVRFEVLHVGEFKTAFEEFSRNSASEAQKESLQPIVEENYSQLLHLIGHPRGLNQDQTEALFERMLLLPEEARSAGLIDAVLYEDEFEQASRQVFGGREVALEDPDKQDKPDLDEMLGNPFAMISQLQKILEPQEAPLPEGPRIAIVYASGAITSGKSKMGLDGSSSMGSETIVEALEAVYDDDQVKAVILRVNSPGGSALASDMIWRAVERVRTRKPVISSMGSVAASGGYWISMGCDRIIAQPSTVTGSLGVVGAIPDLSAALASAGVGIDVLGAGPHTEDRNLLGKGLTPFMRDTLTRSMEQVYETFLSKVSAGRKLDREVVERYAKGRVWTGRDAHAIGLVDGLGGLREAIVMACHLGGGLDPDTTPVRELPRAPSMFEALEETFSQFATIRGLVRELATETGWSEAIDRVDAMLVSPKDRVQASLPFLYRMR